MRADIRYGFIGTGSMGLEHIRNVLALDCAVPVAAFDPDQGSTAEAVETAGENGLETHATLDDLLGRGDLDAVVVSTPNFTHRAVLDRVLATNLHVMVEKPLCTTVEDCVAVVEASSARDAITCQYATSKTQQSSRIVCRRLVISTGLSLCRGKIQQVLRIGSRAQSLCRSPHLTLIDPTVAESYLLRTRNHHALPILDCCHIARRLKERLRSACIEPGDTTPQQLDAQTAVFQVKTIEICDLKLTAHGWTE